MYNTKIFTIDWKKFVLLYLPTALRKVVFYRMLLAITKPIRTIYNRFFNQRTETLFTIRYDSSKGNIERMLNIKYYGAYDASDKKIYLQNKEDDSANFGTFIYTTEGRNKIDAASVSNESEETSYIDAETLQDAFTVYVPTGMSIKVSEIKEDVGQCVLPSQSFNVKLY